jgi:uncharacterized protein (DUF1015 family)
MPEIQPFRGLRYRVPEGDLSRVLAPPYDVMTPAYRDELYARDARNVVRIVLSREPGEAAYESAAATYRGLLAEGVLAEDPEPALYLLEQSFEDAGSTLRRVGVLARFRAEDPERRVILPHEQTRKGPREDRYRLLKATRANFSPIFMMFADAQGDFRSLATAVLTSPPTVSYVDDAGVGHRLWRVSEASRIDGLRKSLGGAPTYIADGHHRYATALRYRDETGPEGAWTFGYFAPMEDPGLRVLPYHRVLSSGPSLREVRSALGNAFRVTDALGPREAAAGAAASAAPHAFGFAEPGGGALVAEALPEALALLSGDEAPSLRALDTYFLQRVVLSKLLGVGDDAVSYVHSLGEAAEAVEKRSCHLCVLVRATPVAQIVAVAEAGESMPAKSTFFHPKLPSGLVIHPLPPSS